MSNNLTIGVQALSLQERIKTKCAYRAVLDWTDLLQFAATSGTFNIFPLQIGDIVDFAWLDVVKAFSGGAITAATLQLGYTGTAAAFLAAKNIFTGGVVADGTFAGTVAHQAATNMLLTLTSTTANLSALTQGRANVYFNVIRSKESTLQPLSAP